MKTTLFKNGRSQAVRIPKEIAFPEEIKNVVIRREGDVITISPSDHSWDDFFDSLEPCDEFPGREQPKAQARDFGDWIE